MMGKNEIKYNLIILILLIVIGGFIFGLMFKKPTSIIDTSHYDKTVDSLKIEIVKHNSRIDSLTVSIVERNKKINGYTLELGRLKNKLDKERKAHEADINRINAMSNTDIASEFTNAFK